MSPATARIACWRTPGPTDAPPCRRAASSGGSHRQTVPIPPRTRGSCPSGRECAGTAVRAEAARRGGRSDVRPRRRAAVVAFLSRFVGRPLLVHFLYSPAKFSAPPATVPPQTYSGPASPDYAGWTLDPALPLAAVIGVGYELGRAVGILEYLEPAVAWLFSPRRFNEAYDKALARVSADLYLMVPDQQQVSYDVRDILDCFERLESLVYGVKSRAECSYAPLAPRCSL